MAPWTLARLERAVETFSAQLQCAICLCAYDKPVSLPCNHCFCEECIHRALELKTQCPICKAPAKKRQLRDDSTVRELLRATEMLCAASGSASEEQHPRKTEQVQTESRTAYKVAAKTAKVAAKTAKVAVKTAKVAIRTAKVAAATSERKASPRRKATRNSQTKNSPSSQTLMDAWISGGSSSLRSQIKTEQQTVTRASPRRVARDLHSQMEASPMSPALFEISAPIEKTTAHSTNREEGSDYEEEMTQVDYRDEQILTAQRLSVNESVMEENETQLETVDVNIQPVISPRRRRSTRNATFIDEIEGETQSEEIMQVASPQVRRSSRNAMSTDEYVGETQVGDLEQQTLTPKRRRSATDVMTDQEQTKVVELKLQTPVLRGRRRSAPNVSVSELPERRRQKSDTKATRENFQAQLPLQVPNMRSRLRATDDVTVMKAQDGPHEANKPPLTPLKRRRSEANGVKETNLTGTHHLNGKVIPTNGLAAKSLAVDSQTEFPLGVEVFQVGDLVEVIERQWVGINKRGGAARIITVHGDGFYGVKFLVETGMDKRVPGSFIRRPPEDIVSDSTPSHAVRKRQRRRLSDSMASPDPASPKIRPSPHSDKKLKLKMKTKTKHSGMVFLCSGFKEDMMQQIDEWAELLGAEVVQYWSNHVTHLIVKCVSADEAKGEDRLLDNSDLESSPRARDGKRKLFSDSKTGRWVKIRSLKYLKALAGGRWIVSDEWLEACADHGGYVSEINYEADGHWKGRRIHDAVKRSRQTRERLLRLSTSNVDHSDIGTMLFSDFCFHVIGDFLPPMPPVTELNTLICMGGGKLIPFMDDIPDEMHKCENRTRKLIIVSDKLNPKALRTQTKHLKAQPQVKAVSAAIIVNYLWVINSISEAKLRELP